jgi:hypothetical protein
VWPAGCGSSRSPCRGGLYLSPRGLAALLGGAGWSAGVGFVDKPLLDGEMRMFEAVGSC